MRDEAYEETVKKITDQIAKSKVQLETISTNAEESWWSATNAMTISSAILIFGVVICIICAVLTKKGHNPDNILKLFGTILIVISAIFLVVAGYSDKQIAPVMGLLGTIAGYLLGKNTTDPNDKKPPDVSKSSDEKKL